MKKVFVTGSEGLIGRVLCARLEAFGYEVTRFDSVFGNDVRRLVMLGQMDVVIHLAAISTGMACKENPLRAIDVNVCGTLAVASAARYCEQIIFASSEWVYHDCGINDLIWENDWNLAPPREIGLYGFTKLAGERIVMESGVENVTVLRFGIVCGGGAKSAVDTLADGDIGSRRTARRFIHIEDLVDGIVASIGLKGKHTLNLTGNRLVSLGDIADAKGLKVVESDPDNPSIRNVDNSLAKSVLNWNPSRAVL